MPDRNSNARITRRTVLKSTGAASLVAATGLAGCMGEDGDGGGNGGNGDGTPTGSATIEVTGVWADQEQEDFQAVVKHAEEQTGHTIEYTPRSTDAILSGTLMDYESGNTPADVVVMPSPARIVSDGEAGHLEPLGDLWSGDNYATDPQRVSAGGETFAAPFKLDVKPGFWYRKSFFDDNGLSEPGSYDEFTSLLDTVSGIDGVDAPIASGNGDGWPLSDQTEAFFLRQDDGAQLQENLATGDADFTDDRVRSAFQEIVDLHDQGYFSTMRPFETQYEYLWDGTHPLYFMGSWTPTMGPVQDPSDLGVFRLPGTKGVGGSINWFTVPTYGDNVSAAKEVVGSFISKEGQQVWAERGGFIASHTGVPKSAYSVEVMGELTEMAAEVTVVPDLDDALGNPFQNEFWSQLKGLWQNPSKDLDSVIDALEQAQNDSLES